MQDGRLEIFPPKKGNEVKWWVKVRTSDLADFGFLRRAAIFFL